MSTPVERQELIARARAYATSTSELPLAAVLMIMRLARELEELPSDSDADGSADTVTADTDPALDTRRELIGFLRENADDLQILEASTVPRVIESAEELNALPLRSAVKDAGDRIWVKFGAEWPYHAWQCADGGFVRWDDPFLLPQPWHVVWSPGVVGSDV